MRKAQKKQIEDFLEILSQAQEELRTLIDKKRYAQACELAADCQQGVILTGSLVEQAEGEGFVTIPLLEEYCECMYQIYEQLKVGEICSGDHIYKYLQTLLLKIKNSVKNDIPVRLEIVFLPYKASMWDSLESVWQAADADPCCDAYVVPIPYYDRKSDGSFGTYHYEGNAFPADVPVVHYEKYELEERMPDIVYIHNPYDEANYVTSIDPRFYSKNLKKYTECLVYIPYYATSGGMSEGQASCPAYYNADYIIIQAEKYRKFFDPALPKEKLVAFGSPKFDRVIKKCGQPKRPPEAWKAKLEGKRVYFYNTSINGMLANTERFLKKMEYVFQCFRGRDDVCLVWRPHPLLESTFDSMRKALRPDYDKLKKDFIEQDIGIYDDTSDITDTIALCDAYIGDAGTSVTSLFGVAGKPLFLLNNNIHTAPEADDWRGEIIRLFFEDGQNEWMVTQGNRLYHTRNHDCRYQFYCDLSEYAYGNYYLRAIPVGKKVYVCPANAQDILVIADGQIEKRIVLRREVERIGAFAGACKIGNDLFLLPLRYPAIVRYNTKKDKIDYIQGYKNIFVKFIQGEWRIGGSCVWNDYLLLASPTDNKVLAIDSKSGNVQLMTAGTALACGCLLMAFDGKDIWMLPYSGTVITRWNPENGKVREYSDIPADFGCRNRMNGYVCKDRPFGMPAFYKNYVILPPYWGNMFLCLDKETGVIEKWELPFLTSYEGKSGYYNPAYIGYIGAFISRTDTLGEWTYRFFFHPARKLYDINVETKEYKELAVEFDLGELKEHEQGFREISDWIQYGCIESFFNPLGRFLDENITGNQFSRTRQLCAYEKIAADSNGTSGLKIHQFACSRLEN